MVFEIFDRNGVRVSVTESLTCIPFDDIPHMANAGYKFKLDGKAISKTRIMEMCNQVPSQPVSSVSVSYSKQVRCIDTGKVYMNQSQAAKDLNIDPAQVSDSIKTGRPRSGYRFERVPMSEVVA